jgi:hypothetical protein
VVRIFLTRDETPADHANSTEAQVAPSAIEIVVMALVQVAMSNSYDRLRVGEPTSGELCRLAGSGPKCRQVAVIGAVQGIGREHLERIFDRFYWVNPSRHESE